MPALYRQYRPSTFSEISGQDHIISVLSQEILTKALAHAYLFQGPRGTGKTSTARVFAKRLNCIGSKNADPCGTCASCTAFQENRFMDILEIDAASNRGIDDIRALRETASLSPVSGTYKIYIIDEVHMLSAPAFAALLKLLEEPPKHVIFILATTELQKVPATIVSRCQLFRFRRASEATMRERIAFLLQSEKREADEDLVSFIISRSDGCFRDAESLLGQLLAQSERKLSLHDASDMLGVPSPEVIESFIDALATGSAPQALTIATKAYEDGYDVDQFLQEAIYVGRDRVIKNVLSEQSVTKLTTIMRAFLVATQDIAIVPDPMIAIEIAIVTVCATTPQRMATSQVADVSAQYVTKNKIVMPIPSPVHKPDEGKFIAQNAPHTSTSLNVNPNPLPERERGTPPTPTSDNPDQFKTIQSSWDDIIQAVRKNNPVASTFLRATSPVSLQDNTLLLQMQFPLHKTFFEKPNNKTIVIDAITSVTTLSLRIMCQLTEQAPSMADQRMQKEAQEADVFKNVQEVFGAKIS